MTSTFFMRILLINPPWVIHTETNVWRSVASVMPPLGIAWLAAVLELDQHDVHILDAHALKMEVDRIPLWVDEHGPFDLVGITATTPLIANALRIARFLKKTDPHCRIVLGGVHPTVLPDEVLAEPAVDLVVRGEGEDTIKDIASGMPPDQIDGVSYRMNGVILHNADRALIRDLDSLPSPAYHLLPMERYRPALGAAKRLPCVSVLSTRGCPGRCTYCYRIFGSRLRVRSGRKVAEEVAYLQERYGIREIALYDDTFTVVKKEVQAFCSAIHEYGLDLTWSCFSRLDNFHEDTFRMMKDAGCHQVMFGVESCDPEILSNINKKVDADQAENVVRSCQKIGLDVRTAFMLGNPGETEESMEANIRFAIRLEPDLAQFNVATPFPGTEMFKWADANGLLLTKRWEDYDLSKPVMNLPSVSADTVQRYYHMAHRRFFLRPSFLLKRLKRLKNVSEWKAALGGIRLLLNS